MIKINKTLRKNLGFTLIELLVVVGIISIMAVALLAILNPYTQIQKANDSKKKADLSQIQKALESYYQDKGRYPDSSGSPNYCLRDIASPFTNYCGNSNWAPYMNIVPKDSKAGYSYAYLSPDGQSYYLYASLERGVKDSQVCFSNGAKCTNAPDNACGSGKICNYGITSPNTNP